MHKHLFFILACFVTQNSVNAMKAFSLHEAAFMGDVTRATALLDNGADTNAFNKPKGLTPLHIATFNGGHPAVINLLLDRGANINQRDIFGRTPLHHAAFWGNTEIVQLLLARGANVHIVDINGRTPFTSILIDISLSMAIEQLINNHIAQEVITEPLTSAMPNATEPPLYTGESPLHAAVREGDLIRLTTLLKAPDANIDEPDIMGFTPLDSAVSNGHLEIVQILIATGAYLDIRETINGKFQLHGVPIMDNPNMDSLINDYGQRIMEAKQRALDNAQLIALSTHERLGSESPLALLSQYLLSKISQLVKNYENHDARQPRQ